MTRSAPRSSALSPRLGDEDSSALPEADPRFSTNLLKSYKSSRARAFGVRCVWTPRLVARPPAWFQLLFLRTKSGRNLRTELVQGLKKIKSSPLKMTQADDSLVAQIIRVTLKGGFEEAFPTVL